MRGREPPDPRSISGSFLLMRSSTFSNSAVLPKAVSAPFLRRVPALVCWTASGQVRAVDKPCPSSSHYGKKLPVEKTVNPTDPEAGMLKRPGKPTGPHYLSHQSVDPAHGIVVDVAVTPGNVNDSGP